MTTKITIGEKLDGGAVTLNVESLIYSRALIQANSGGGKSGLMRVIAEQVAAKIPTIIIDKEGEYHTLREKLDIVLVGERGEIGANVRSAGLLARKLVELGASAVCDLYELKLPQQREWVKNFVESLMSLPKNLWHPTLVLIDECDVFAPEKGFGESTATDAVIDLMARGRKHGLCGVPATQRLSKLHKNVAAEVNNVFIGRTWLDTDQSRAGKMLGLSSSGALILRDFKTREFQAFGPALETNGVIHFRVADCETTIPKPGDRAALTPPKASHVVTEIAEKLKDLPQQAEAEIKSFAESQARVRELEREVKTLKRGAPVQTVEKPVEKIVEKHILRDGQLKRLESFASSLLNTATKLADVATEIKTGLSKINSNGHKPTAQAQAVSKPQPVPMRQPSAPKAAPTITDQNLSGPEQRILDATAWLESLGIDEPNQVAVAFLAGYTFGGGAFNNPRGSLRTKGFVEYVGSGQIKLTDEGRERASYPDEALTKDELQARVLERLPGPEQKILRVLIDAYPESLDKEECAARAGYAMGGAFNNPCGRLRSLGIAEYPTRGQIKAAPVVFLEG